MPHDDRIERHPILPIPDRRVIPILWKGEEIAALEGETMAAALFAHGVHVFGHHAKDGAPQGIFCANGQCSQCLVLADGVPVKSCMELVRPGVRLEPADGLPELPPLGKSGAARPTGPVETVRVPVLIIGGGPAGLSAAAELGRRGVETLIVDDKHRLGGKLVLQTHRFFGSVEAVFAGTRGIDIATRLEKDLRALPSVRIWLQTSALAVYSDGRVGLLQEGRRHVLVEPEILLVASGAREKNLAFPGNTLPGVYGAGAFQTLVNRDLVRPARRLFIVGGGNVGLIAGYHALQAGIEVVGLVEAMAECGGYKVHRDKLVRLGVPVYTRHTVVSANGDGEVESVTIARVDERFRPVEGTERSFACDTLLIAVGLDPVDEFYHKAKAFGLAAYAAGDAEEIAEASAAIFSGKIRGLEIARALGRETGEVSPDWYRTADILKAKPGTTVEEAPPAASAAGVYPALHCVQEIPCDPCTAMCPRGLIVIEGADIRSLPAFLGEKGGKGCSACEKCVAMCPGLAVTLVDERKDKDFPTVTIPFEFLPDTVKAGDEVIVQDTAGEPLGAVRIEALKAIKANDRTILVKVRAPRAYAAKIAGLRLQPAGTGDPLPRYVRRTADDTIVCRCERVTAGEIRALIRSGVRDISEIKAVTRTSMGSCGAKTCTPLLHRLFREEGVPESEIVDQPKRPLFMEVPLGVLAGESAAEPDRSPEPAPLAGKTTQPAPVAPASLKEGGKAASKPDLPLNPLLGAGKTTQPAPVAPASSKEGGKAALKPLCYDAIVIGAGSVGTPAAMSLAEAGLKVLVLDGNASVGQGSNKAAIGGIRATHSDPAKIRLSLRSLEVFGGWEETHGDDIGWVKGGYVFVSYREDEERTLRDLLAVQKKYGLDIDWLDAASLRRLVPDLNPDGLRGGTFSPGDGHASPLTAGHAIYARARRLGAEFRFREPVTAIAVEGGRVRGVKTPAGAYAAEVVINAAGGRALETARLAGVDVPVVPESHEAAVTEAAAPFLGPMLVDTRPEPGSSNYYFYQHETGQVVFCISPSPAVSGTDTRETSGFLPMVARRMVGLMPRLRTLRVRRTWRGLYPMTPDGFPIVDWAGPEGLLHAVGMCGQGFMLGPGLGELVARMITKTTTADDRETLGWLRLDREFKGEEKLK